METFYSELIEFICFYIGFLIGGWIYKKVKYFIFKNRNPVPAMKLQDKFKDWCNKWNVPCESLKELRELTEEVEKEIRIEIYDKLEKSILEIPDIIEKFHSKMYESPIKKSPK